MALLVYSVVSTVSFYSLFALHYLFLVFPSFPVFSTSSICVCVLRTVFHQIQLVVLFSLLSIYILYPQRPLELLLEK